MSVVDRQSTTEIEHIAVKIIQMRKSEIESSAWTLKKYILLEIEKSDILRFGG